MTRKIDRTTLIGFLEQLASMQSAFCNQSVIILLSEMPGGMQSTCYYTDCLELRSRIADRFLVDRESLCEILVCNFLKIILIRDLTASNE